MFASERPQEEDSSDEDNSDDEKDEVDDGDSEREEGEKQTPTTERHDVGTSVSYRTIPRYCA